MTALERNMWARAWRFIGITYTVELPLIMGAVWFDYRLIFVALLVAAGLAAVALWTLRCPACGKLVTNRFVKLAGISVQVPFGFPERRCSKCGQSLAEQASPHS